MRQQLFAGRNGRIGLLVALIGGALLLALAVGSSALAGGGNSASAKHCQQQGWIGLVRTDGSTFANEGACVSYAAHGGTLVPFTGCFVLDTSKPADYSTSSLGAVVAGATGGDALTVQGTCIGPTTIDRSLTVTGQASPGYSTPTLEGPADHVLVVDSGTVTLLDTLTITGGHTVLGIGGGILNAGDLTLNSCTVSGNSSRNGGGIHNDVGGTLDARRKHQHHRQLHRNPAIDTQCGRRGRRDHQRRQRHADPQRQRQHLQQRLWRGRRALRAQWFGDAQRQQQHPRQHRIRQSMEGAAASSSAAPA